MPRSSLLFVDFPSSFGVPVTLRSRPTSSRSMRISALAVPSDSVGAESRSFVQCWWIKRVQKEVFKKFVVFYLLYRHKKALHDRLAWTRLEKRPVHTHTTRAKTIRDCSRLTSDCTAGLTGCVLTTTEAQTREETALASLAHTLSSFVEREAGAFLFLSKRLLTFAGGWKSGSKYYGNMYRQNEPKRDGERNQMKVGAGFLLVFVVWFTTAGPGMYSTQAKAFQIIISTITTLWQFQSFKLIHFLSHLRSISIWTNKDIWNYYKTSIFLRKWKYFPTERH